MAYRLSDGTTLTDEQIDELAEKAEHGELPGKAGQQGASPPYPEVLHARPFPQAHQFAHR